MGLFDLNILAPVDDNKSHENTLAGKSAAILASYEQLQGNKVAIIDQHINGIPSPGQCVFVWTTNQFNTMAFIVWIIRELGFIDELTITTYSIGATAINTLIKWYDAGKIKNIFFYLAAYNKRIAPKNVDLLMAQASSRDGITVAFGFNHSKILLAGSGEKKIVIAGSGNFSENAYNEQYVICNDKRIYDFYSEQIRENHSDGQ
ncbi:MAG: hypothetical protein K5651_05185 [Bacteroidales bacterium]|nr:hypothetical protein [Bacteroidales bacterium]